MDIKKITFPDNQYYKVEMPKKIIVLHHTVSGEGVEGDINWWKQTEERVATPYIIGRDGVINQIFDDKYWAHHLGIKIAQLRQFGSTATNERLNQLSVGIELDSWGGLVKKNGKWYNFTGIEIKPENVVEIPKGYRGYYGFEKYTDKQISSLKELLLMLISKYNIPKDFKENMFDFNEKAVKGYHGIWSHTSFRPDKSDIYPDTKLIEMLKSL